VDADCLPGQFVLDTLSVFLSNPEVPPGCRINEDMAGPQYWRSIQLVEPLRQVKRRR
jgi:hypothetical protein